MDSDVTQTSSDVLTSTVGSVISSASENDETAPAVDSVPSSSSDANSVDVSARKKSSDDPISSTSDVADKLYAKISTSAMGDSKGVLGKTELDNEVDLFANDCNLSHPPSEKITENVEDIVSDLENLLGNPTDHFSVSVAAKKGNDVSELDDIFFDVDKLDESKTDRDVSIRNRTSNLVDKSVPCESNVSVEDVKSESRNILKGVDVSPDTNKQDSDENSKESTCQEQSDTTNLQESDVTSIPPSSKPEAIDVRDENVKEKHSKSIEEGCSTNLNQTTIDSIDNSSNAIQDSNSFTSKAADLSEDSADKETTGQKEDGTLITQSDSIPVLLKVEESNAFMKETPVQNLNQEKSSEEGTEISQSDEVLHCETFEPAENSLEITTNEVSTKINSEIINNRTENVLTESTSETKVEDSSEAIAENSEITTGIIAQIETENEEISETSAEEHVTTHDSPKAEMLTEDASKEGIQETTILPEEDQAKDTNDISKALVEDISEAELEDANVTVAQDTPETTTQDPPETVTNEDESNADPEEKPTEDTSEANEDASKADPGDTSNEVNEDESKTDTEETSMEDDKEPDCALGRDSEVAEVSEKKPDDATDVEMPNENISTEVDEELECTRESEENSDHESDTSKHVENSEGVNVSEEIADSNVKEIPVLNIIEDTKSSDASESSEDIPKESIESEDLLANDEDKTVTDEKTTSVNIEPEEENSDLPEKSPIIQDECSSEVLENTAVTDIEPQDDKKSSSVESENMVPTTDEVDDTSKTIPDDIPIKESTENTKPVISPQLEEIEATNNYLESRKESNKSDSSEDDESERHKEESLENAEAVPQEKEEDSTEPILKANEESNPEENEALDGNTNDDTNEENPIIESAPMEVELEPDTSENEESEESTCGETNADSKIEATDDKLGKSASAATDDELGKSAEESSSSPPAEPEETLVDTLIETIVEPTIEETSVSDLANQVEDEITNTVEESIATASKDNEETQILTTESTLPDDTKEIQESKEVETQEEFQTIVEGSPSKSVIIESSSVQPSEMEIVNEGDMSKKAETPESTEGAEEVTSKPELEEKVESKPEESLSTSDDNIEERDETPSIEETTNASTEEQMDVSIHTESPENKISPVDVKIQELDETCEIVESEEESPEIETNDDSQSVNTDTSEPELAHTDDASEVSSSILKKEGDDTDKPEEFKIDSPGLEMKEDVEETDTDANELCEAEVSPKSEQEVAEDSTQEEDVKETELQENVADSTMEEAIDTSKSEVSSTMEQEAVEESAMGEEEEEEETMEVSSELMNDENDDDTKEPFKSKESSTLDKEVVENSEMEETVETEEDTEDTVKTELEVEVAENSTKDEDVECAEEAEVVEDTIKVDTDELQKSSLLDQVAGEDEDVIEKETKVHSSELENEEVEDSIKEDEKESCDTVVSSSLEQKGAEDPAKDEDMEEEEIKEDSSELKCEHDDANKEHVKESFKSEEESSVLKQEVVEDSVLDEDEVEKLPEDEHVEDAKSPCVAVETSTLVSEVIKDVLVAEDSAEVEDMKVCSSTLDKGLVDVNIKEDSNEKEVTEEFAENIEEIKLHSPMLEQEVVDSKQVGEEVKEDSKEPFMPEEPSALEQVKDTEMTESDETELDSSKMDGVVEVDEKEDEDDPSKSEKLATLEQEVAEDLEQDEDVPELEEAKVDLQADNDVNEPCQTEESPISKEDVNEDLGMVEDNIEESHETNVNSPKSESAELPTSEQEIVEESEKIENMSEAEKSRENSPKFDTEAEDGGNQSKKTDQVEVEASVKDEDITESEETKADSQKLTTDLKDISKPCSTEELPEHKQIIEDMSEEESNMEPLELEDEIVKTEQSPISEHELADDTTHIEDVNDNDDAPLQEITPDKLEEATKTLNEDPSSEHEDVIPEKESLKLNFEDKSIISSDHKEELEVASISSSSSLKIEGDSTEDPKGAELEETANENDPEDSKILQENITETSTIEIESLEEETTESSPVEPEEVVSEKSVLFAEHEEKSELTEREDEKTSGADENQTIEEKNVFEEHTENVKSEEVQISTTDEEATTGAKETSTSAHEGLSDKQSEQTVDADGAELISIDQVVTEGPEEDESEEEPTEEIEIDTKSLPENETTSEITESKDVEAEVLAEDKNAEITESKQPDTEEESPEDNQSETIIADGIEMEEVEDSSAEVVKVVEAANSMECKEKSDALETPALVLKENEEVTKSSKPTVLSSKEVEEVSIKSSEEEELEEPVHVKEKDSSDEAESKDASEVSNPPETPKPKESEVSEKLEVSTSKKAKESEILTSKKTDTSAIKEPVESDVSIPPVSEATQSSESENKDVCEGANIKEQNIETSNEEHLENDQEIVESSSEKTEETVLDETSKIKVDSSKEAEEITMEVELPKEKTIVVPTLIEGDVSVTESKTDPTIKESTIEETVEKDNKLAVDKQDSSAVEIVTKHTAEVESKQRDKKMAAKEVENKNLSENISPLESKQKSEDKEDVQIAERVSDTHDKEESTEKLFAEGKTLDDDKFEKSHVTTTEVLKIIPTEDSISDEVKEETSSKKADNKEKQSSGSIDEIPTRDQISKAEIRSITSEKPVVQIEIKESTEKPEVEIKPKTKSEVVIKDTTQQTKSPAEEPKVEPNTVMEVIGVKIKSATNKTVEDKIQAEKPESSIEEKEVKSKPVTEKSGIKNKSVEDKIQAEKPDSSIEEKVVKSTPITEKSGIKNKSVEDKIQAEKPESSIGEKEVKSKPVTEKCGIKNKSVADIVDETKKSEQETNVIKEGTDAKPTGKLVTGKKLEKGKRKYTTRKSGATKEESVAEITSSETSIAEPESTISNKIIEEVNTKETKVSKDKQLGTKKEVEERRELQLTQDKNKETLQMKSKNKETKSNVSVDVLEETKNSDKGTEKNKLETSIEVPGEVEESNQELPVKKKRGKRKPKASPIAKDKLDNQKREELGSKDQEEKSVGTEKPDVETEEKIVKVKRGRPLKKIHFKTKIKKESLLEVSQNKPDEVNAELENRKEPSFDKDFTPIAVPTENLEVVQTGTKRKRNLRNQRNKLSVSPAAETEETLIKETSTPDKPVEAAAGPKRRRNLRNQVDTAEGKDSSAELATKNIKVSGSPATETESIHETPVKENTLPEKPVETTAGPKRRRNLRNQIETSADSPSKEAGDSPTEPAPKRRRILKKQAVEADTSISLETEEVIVEQTEKSAEPIKRRRRNQHEASSETEPVEADVAEEVEKVVIEPPPVTKRRRHWRSQPEKPALDTSKTESDLTKPESETEKIEKPAEPTVGIKRRRQGRSLPDKTIEAITNEAEAVVKPEESAGVTQETIEKPAEQTISVKKRRGWRKELEVSNEAESAAKAESHTQKSTPVKTEQTKEMVEERADKHVETPVVKKKRGWKKELEVNNEAESIPKTESHTQKSTPVKTEQTKEIVEETADKHVEMPVVKKKRGWKKELEVNNEAESIPKTETEAQKSTPVKTEHADQVGQEAIDKPVEAIVKKRRGWKKDLSVSNEAETDSEKRASKVEHGKLVAQEATDKPAEPVAGKKRRGWKKEVEISNEAESVSKTQSETQKSTPGINQIDQETTDKPVEPVVIKKKRGWKKELEISNEAESISNTEIDKRTILVKPEQSDKPVGNETIDKPVEPVVGKKRRGWKKELEVSNEAESVSKMELETEKSPQVKAEQNENIAEPVTGSKRKRNVRNQHDEAVTQTHEAETAADQSDIPAVKRRRLGRNQVEKPAESTMGTRRKRSLRNQEAESSVVETEAEVMKNRIEHVGTSQMDNTPESFLASQSSAHEKNVEEELVKAAMDASSVQNLEPQESHQVPDCSEVIKTSEDETNKNEEMMLIQAAQESQNREVEVSKQVTIVQEEYKKPLNIVVDNVSVIKEAESTTCEDNEIPQKEFSSDEDKQAEYSSKISQSQELKLTITKTKTDEPSSILKIYDPKHPAGVEISPSESETEAEELPIPKFVIKQSSPKVMSPLKITIKPVLKPEEQHNQKGSPKLIIKPIVKPDDENKHPEEKHHSPKITIKPIIKPSDDSDRCNSPKITIKPIIKPTEASTSPKIKFKPITKPEEVKEEVIEEAESREKERIVLKINKNNIPQKEVKKNDDNEKLGKIKVKFSKEGRHAHIVNEEEERELLNEAEAIKPEPIVDNIPKEPATPEPALNTEEMPQKVEETVDSPALSVDSPISEIVITIPRKRGRPRKVPLVIREEFKDVKEPETSIEGSSVGEKAVDPNGGRPKRSCRGPSVTMTLGIKPRKPRGAGRGRIGSRGGGRVEKEPKKGKISESKLKLIKEAAITARVSESLENQDVEMTTVGNPSPIIIEDSSEDKSKDSIVEDKPKVLSEDKSKDSVEFKAKEDTGEDKPKEDTGEDKPKEEPTTVKEESKQESVDSKEEGLDISDTVIMYEEETRMSADTNNSRAQTPAKQVLTSNVQDVVEESQSSVQSSATTESAKGKKGSRLEVFREPEGAIISADQLAEYYWGGGGPFMLQEQVAQFLGIKSFKRKYPGIQRRTVDMQERDFIRESSLASENMCDLGLTAVNSADILDIMYSDFQNKYEEYCKHLRDRQTKDITNKQKALSLAASQEKTKLDIMQQAVESAAQWNISFNKTRREERKACMDLQTFTINYPKGSVKQVPKNKIGHYPIALVPGQYTDYYRTYTPTELNNLPLNTMLYHPINVHNDEDSQSDGSGSESDSSSSGSDSSDSDSSDEDCTICSPSATPKKAVL